MRKIRNSLLIAAAILIAATSLLAATDASAGSMVPGFKQSWTTGVSEIGTGTKAGEPDGGGGSKNDPPPSEPNDEPGEDLGGIVNRSPSGFGLIVAFWVRHILGAGW
jgi:hypothetical protein